MDNAQYVGNETIISSISRGEGPGSLGAPKTPGSPRGQGSSRMPQGARLLWRPPWDITEVTAWPKTCPSTKPASISQVGSALKLQVECRSRAAPLLAEGRPGMSRYAVSVSSPSARFVTTGVHGREIFVRGILLRFEVPLKQPA